ncbi:RNA polymerase sigma factor [Terrabacter carboxydivorans]|uniref:RNA polymerase sigma factor 70 region 4 type 2 domain-containing protein n=1 Tax=Terrabacter carboxydivorans TaxID=619730 RepID=A0ABP5Z9J4_9MICO
MRGDDVVRSVYERSYARLVTQLVALCGNRSEAEDAAQDAFLEARTHRTDFLEAPGKDAWLRSVALGRVRRSPRALLPVLGATRSRPEPDIDLGAETADDQVTVVYALSQLSLPVRVAVVLHYVAGLSTGQISTELGISEGTTRSRLARGRAQLARDLFDREDDSPCGLVEFARKTDRTVVLLPFEEVVSRRRRARRRHSAAAAALALTAALAVALAVTGLARLAPRQLPPGAQSPILVPGWTADQIVGHPEAFVVTQLQSRTQPSTTLTVWKRCTEPRADHDCFGREAIAVVDASEHRLVTLGAVTGSRQQPSLGDDGLLREVGDGLWYWAHVAPGPYLLSPTMHQAADLTVLDHRYTHTFGVPSIECADRVGLCTLNLRARTLERLAVPQIPDTRWATPTAAGCGLWGLAGVGGNLRLVIQQRDGSFAGADLPEDRDATTMAEGGRHCEVAYYEGIPTTSVRDQLVVSLDQGRTWQSRRSPVPHDTGLVEERPHLRFLLSPRWADLPAMTGPLEHPGPLRPL